MTRKLLPIISLFVIVSMALSGCQSQPPTPAAVPTGTPIVVEKVVEKVVTSAPQIVEKVVVVTPTPVPPTPVPPTAVPKTSDTIVIGMQQEPDSLHPYITSMTASNKVLAAVLMGCMCQNDKAEWVPLGCEQVPNVDNGGAKLVGEGADRHLEVTYKIRKGWRWTDGVPVTTKDVLYTWKLEMDPTFNIVDRSAVEKIYELVAVDDSTFVTKFMSEKQAKAAAAGTLKGAVDFAAFKADYAESGYADQVGPVVDPSYWFIGAPGGSWLPSHILSKVAGKDQEASEFARKPVGDGPYVLKEWKPNQELILEKSDKPFPLGDAKIKTIVFRFFAETAAIKAALQKGEIDAVTMNTGGLTTSDAPDLDKIEALGKYKALYQPGYAYERIDLNMTKFPLDDVKVRQALYHATDKKTLVERIYYDKQTTTDLPLPRLSWAYTDNITKYPYDPAKAKSLLKEAGWDCTTMPCTKKVTEGGKEVTKKLEFTLMTTDRADRQQLAQVIQQQWKAINVGVNIQFLYGRGLFSPCSAGGPLYCRTFDAAIYTSSTGDDATFNTSGTCASIPSKENGWVGQNNPGFCNKVAEEALNKSEKDVDIALSSAKRKPYIEKFFQEWSKEAPMIPLFANSAVGVQRIGLKNWKPGPTQYAPETWNVWEWELSK